MLKVEEIISSFIKVILKVFSKFTPNTINKSLAVSKILSEENFKVRPHNRNGVFMVALLLNLFEADGLIEIWSGKKIIIYPSGAWCFEIIFILLTKVVVIYIRFSWISFQGFSLKWLFLKLYQCLNLYQFYEHLYKSGEVILG